MSIESVMIVILGAVLVSCVTLLTINLGNMALIKECEKELPRTMTCELYARPKEVEG